MGTYCPFFWSITWYTAYNEDDLARGVGTHDFGAYIAIKPITNMPVTHIYCTLKHVLSPVLSLPCRLSRTPFITPIVDLGRLSFNEGG